MQHTRVLTDFVVSDQSIRSPGRNTVALASLGSVFKSGTHRELIQLASRVSAGYVIRNLKQALLASDFSTCYDFVVAESVSS
jgi:hypothetical protein